MPKPKLGPNLISKKVLLISHPDLYNHHHKVGQPTVHVFTLVVNTWERNGETFTASKGVWAEGGVAIRSFYVVVETVLFLFVLQRPACLNQYRKQGPCRTRTPFSSSEGVTYLMPDTLKRTTRYTSLSWMRRRRKQCPLNSGAMAPCMCTIRRLNITDPGKNYPRRHGRPAIQAKMIEEVKIDLLSKIFPLVPRMLLLRIS